jgi:hypothetical protein
VSEGYADEDERRRARRREFIRTHHPDRGGDPAAFITGLADLDRGERPGDDRADRVRVTVVARRPILARLWRALRRRPGPRRVR